MIRFLLGLAVAGAASAAVAQETTCEIEDYVARDQSGFTVISGAATCETGRLAYRLYDGETFVGSGTTRVTGYVFSILEPIALPENLDLRYVVQE